MPARPAPGWRRRRAGRRCPMPPVDFGSTGCSARRSSVPCAGRLAGWCRLSLRAAWRTGASGSLLRSSCASLSSPALVSNAVSLSPLMSRPPGFGGLDLVRPGRSLDELRAGHLPQRRGVRSRRRRRRRSQQQGGRRASAASILRAEMPRGSSSSSTGCKPRQRLVVGAIVAHPSHASQRPPVPTTTQLCAIIRIRWQSTVECACEVVPI